MKHSKSTKALALLMSMTMITSVFVGNTLSRYVTSVSSTDNARVAVWGINGGNTQMNLFDVSYIKDGKDIAKSNNAATDPEDKIMAPGTSGEAPFSIINFEQDVAPEVAYQVALTFDDSAIADEIKNNPSVQWKLDNGAWGTLEQLKTSILSLSGDASGVKVYEPGQFADAFEDNTPHTIAWQWLLDNNKTITVDGNDMSSNEYDTYMGNLALTGDLEAVVTVGITATQVDDLVTNAYMLDGINQTVYSFDDEPLVLRSASDIGNFQSVNVNGSPIDPSNYDVTSGSTVVTLKSEYLATLTAGSYTIDIVSSDMTASTSFKVVDGLTQDESGNYLINTAQDLFTLSKIVNSGTNNFDLKTVLMTADIDLRNKVFTPIGHTVNGSGDDSWDYSVTFMGTFDGQGHTIKNLNVETTDQDTNNNSTVGLFGAVAGGTIKNLNIDTATITGTHFAGVIVGVMGTTRFAYVKDCNVTNATVTSTYYNSENSGDKAGIIVGCLNDNYVDRVTVTDSTVTASRDAGQVVGAGRTDKVTNCTVANVTVSHNGLGTGANIRNELVGRVFN